MSNKTLTNLSKVKLGEKVEIIKSNLSQLKNGCVVLVTKKTLFGACLQILADDIVFCIGRDEASQILVKSLCE